MAFAAWRRQQKTYGDGLVIESRQVELALGAVQSLCRWTRSIRTSFIDWLARLWEMAYRRHLPARLDLLRWEGHHPQWYGGYNCMNYHSFCMQNPDQMMFHMRTTNGGTYIIDHNAIEKLDTKTDSTISNMTYPYCILRKISHHFAQYYQTVLPFRNRIEDGGVRHRVGCDCLWHSEEADSEECFGHYETSSRLFPSFSPDGKWLYYCVTDSCTMPDSMLPSAMPLCVPFDAATGTIHQPADTIVNNTVHSSSFQNLSRWTLSDVHAYSLRTVPDLAQGRRSRDGSSEAMAQPRMDISTVNSNDTEKLSLLEQQQPLGGFQQPPRQRTLHIGHLPHR